MKFDETGIREVASGATSRIELWIKVLRTARIRNLLEVGVWKGEFAEQMLKQCDFLEQYYMLDPWANLPDWNKPYNVDTKTFDHIYDEAMRRTDFAASKRVVLRGRTKEVIDQIPDNSLDFAYIDGDHTLRGITIDLIRVLPKIKDGGLLGGDDFDTTPWRHGIAFEPSLVCPLSIYLAEAFNLPIAALPFDQFILQKGNSQSFTFIDITNRYSDLSLNRLPMSVFKSAIKQRLKGLLPK